MALSFAGSGPPPALCPLHIAACGEHEVDARWSVWDKGPYRSWNHTVYHILAGDCTLAWEGREWRLGPGAIHLVPGHRFVRRRTQGMHHRWINYNLDHLSSDLHLSRLAEPLSLPLDTHRPWADAVAEAARLGMAPSGAIATASPYVLAAIEGCLQQAVACVGARIGPPLSDFTGEALRTALAYIERHYQRMPSLGEVARACGRSPNYLQSKFSAAFGVSPTAYARECRLRDAVHLLTASGLQIQEIAKRCGYEDPLHFSRVFSRQFGVSPLAVRRDPARTPVWTALDRGGVLGRDARRVRKIVHVEAKPRHGRRG